MDDVDAMAMSMATKIAELSELEVKCDRLRDQNDPLRDVVAGLIAITSPAEHWRRLETAAAILDGIDRQEAGDD